MPDVRRVRTALVLLAVVPMLVGVLVVGAAAPSEAKRYTPRSGVTTNAPLGSEADRRAIMRHLVRSIDAVPRRGQIRVASWNIRSNAFVDALIRAHQKRRIQVRVVVDRLNANPDNPNAGVKRLTRALKKNGNQSRRPSRRSGVTKCVSACRGAGGIAHSKFFLFSRVGGAKDVVVNGSANATDLAATHQWNDVYTVVNRRRVYEDFKRVFGEMYRDENVKQGFVSHRFGNLQTIFLPFRGRSTKTDPIMKDLNRVRCGGARNTGNGRTRLRIAMTSWHGDRGIKIAHKVRDLKNKGCDVKIVYAVAGNEVLRILRRGGARPVPLRQIVQDFTGDGVYDRYLHTKVLTIAGRYQGDRSAWVTRNGSTNWTPVALNSDDADLRIFKKSVVKRYNRYIDRLFANPPHNPSRGTRGTGSTGEERVVAGRTAAAPVARTPSGVPIPEHLPLGSTVDGIDPYALIQVD